MNIRKFFDHASDMAAIRALMMRYKVALDQGDVDLAMQCHAVEDDISAVSLDSVYFGRDEVRAFFGRIFSPSVREGISRPSRTTYIAVQHDTAVLILEHEMQILQPHVCQLEVRVHFTLVRTADGWRILSSHVSAPRSAFIEVGDSGH